MIVCWSETAELERERREWKKGRETKENETVKGEDFQMARSLALICFYLSWRLNLCSISETHQRQINYNIYGLLSTALFLHCRRLNTISTRLVPLKKIKILINF